MQCEEKEKYSDKGFECLVSNEGKSRRLYSFKHQQSLQNKEDALRKISCTSSQGVFGGGHEDGGGRGLGGGSAEAI